MFGIFCARMPQDSFQLFLTIWSQNFTLTKKIAKLDIVISYLHTQFQLFLLKNAAMVAKKQWTEI